MAKGEGHRARSRHRLGIPSEPRHAHPAGVELLPQIMKPLYVSSLFPSLLLLAPLAAQDAIQLQPPKSGKIAFVQLGKQEQNINAGGQEMNVTQEMTHHFTIEVTGVADNGTRTFTVTIERINGKLDIPMAGEIEFDSAAKADGATEEEGEDGPMGGMGLPSGTKISAGLRELAGKSFTTEVSADGTIVGIAGFDEARKAAKQAFGGPAAQMMEGAFADRGLQGLVRGAIGHLPKEAVSAGSEWETKNDVGGQLPMEQSLKITVAKLDAATAELTYAGESKVKEGARMPMPGAEVEGGKVEGKATISRADGFTIHSKISSGMSIFAENEMVGEMTIEMKMTSETKRADAAKAEPKQDEAQKEPAKTPEAGK